MTTVAAMATPAHRAARPELAPLWDELARRLGASERPVASVTLRGLDERQRAGLADLLGRERLVPPTCRVAIAAVTAALGLDHEGDLRRLVGELRGPIVSRAEDRRREQAAREALWAWLDTEAGRIGAAGWSTGLRAAGVQGGDVAGYRARLETVVAVVGQVVAAVEPVSLAGLASTSLGDPHGLDPGTALAPLVLGALADRLGLGSPTSAEEARTVWAAAGVVADELSSKVLVFGLRCGHAGSPLGVALSAFAEQAEPLVVTLSQLRRWPVAPITTEVRVVENPSVVAEGARAQRGRAADGPPLVCSSGWPNVAVMTLLRQLADAGAAIRCHADFDGPGILIVRYLMARVGAEPWRMGRAEYQQAASRGKVALAGSIADTPWDPALATAMRARGKAVYEEDVTADLLGLRPAPAR